MITYIVFARLMFKPLAAEILSFILTLLLNVIIHVLKILSIPVSRVLYIQID